MATDNPSPILATMFKIANPAFDILNNRKVSMLKVENVVKAPNNPMAKKKFQLWCWDPDHPKNKASAKEPIRFTTSVPQGKSPCGE